MEKKAMMKAHSPFIWIAACAAWSLGWSLTSAAQVIEKTQDFVLTTQLGGNVAIDGRTAVAGTDRGEAFLFEQPPAGWGDQIPPISLSALANLTTMDASDSLFGSPVAISGDVVVVGAQGGRGAAYIFERNGTVWECRQKLSPGSNSFFGHRLAVSGNTIVVHASDTDWGDYDIDRTGAIYVFRRSVGSSVWSADDVLIGRELSSCTVGRFGTVGVSGDTIVAGTCVLQRSGSPTSQWPHSWTMTSTLPWYPLTIAMAVPS